jgi:hypothetical protein
MIGNYIKAVATAVSRTTAQLMKTGQTTSYRTGDDGDLERGRNVSFTTLAENNVFGNTNRFTDELGGQTYTKNIVIDWSTYNGSTVLGWRRTRNSSNWLSAIDGALIVSIAPFTSGWRLPNVQELFSIQFFGGSGKLNYAPFTTAAGFDLWTSTTNPAQTNQIFNLSSGTNNLFIASSQLSVFSWIPCRTFTVTGTILS